MRKSIAIIVVIMLCSVSEHALAGWICPNCQMYRTKKFCTRCGAPQPTKLPARSARYSSSPTYSSGFLSNVGERFAGMGRGLVTVGLSPLNCIRGALVGGAWSCEGAGMVRNHDGTYSNPTPRDPGPEFAAQTLIWVCLPIGVVSSSFATCADAINGTLDVATLGYYGDWLYEGKQKGSPTPWIWERKWMSNEIPWIDR